MVALRGSLQWAKQNLRTKRRKAVLIEQVARELLRIGERMGRRTTIALGNGSFGGTLPRGMAPGLPSRILEDLLIKLGGPDQILIVGEYRTSRRSASGLEVEPVKPTRARLGRGLGVSRVRQPRPEPVEQFRGSKRLRDRVAPVKPTPTPSEAALAARRRPRSSRRAGCVKSDSSLGTILADRDINASMAILSQADYFRLTRDERGLPFLRNTL